MHLTTEFHKIRKTELEEDRSTLINIYFLNCVYFFLVIGMPNRHKTNTDKIDLESIINQLM